MAWQSDGLNSSNLFWTYNIGESGMTRRNSSPSSNASLWYTSTSKTFSPNKNYQFITSVDNFDDAVTTTFLDIITPWGKTFSHTNNADKKIDTRPATPSDRDLFFFSSPNSEITSSDMVQYKSTYAGFGLTTVDGIPVITNFKIVELDWFIQGWALSKNTSSPNIYNAGWSYFDSTNSFYYYPEDIGTNAGIKKSLGFDSSSNIVSQGYTMSNYIARYIPYPTFNLTLDINTGTSTQSYVDLYLVDSLSNNLKTNSVSTFETELNNGQFLGRIDQNGNNTYKFYNLIGNKYVLIRANGVYSSQQGIQILNISIDGAYQETDNNEQFLFTNSGTYSEPTDLCIIGGSSDATYSVVVVNENTQHELAGTPSNTFIGATGFPGFFSNLYGDVINLNFLTSKVGNGRFKSGVWENGVWNSGWRVDTEVYEFDDVEISLLMKTTNTIWRIQIKGPKTSTINFKVGDRVSIGNIVGIDINENRKLMKNYFTVLSVSDTNIVVDFNNTFPLRRIEKDSQNHKIKVSKNIWLNGGFLNGYFEGIWNNGLFKGFPFITEMYNTHWIDGRYDGGHFYGEYPESTFVDTYWISNSQYSLGLTFGATAHGFEIGDLISIDKDDKLLNPQYDGDATVVDVIDDYMILVDKNFGASSTLEGGTIRRRTGTAVIQNFKFYDNNVGEQTISDTDVIDSGNLQGVYRYNSWVDVKYLDESATNLGRTQVLYSPDYGEYSQNNLYGHITEDVLDSVSSFRNSHNLSKTVYSLGTKYKIYEDFLGDISEFNEPFNLIPLYPDTTPNMDNFYNNGWTYSYKWGVTSSLNINREPSEAMKIETAPLFPFLPSIFNIENQNISIDKKRYSVIEFDLNSYVSEVDTFPILGSLDIPSVWLLNYITIPSTSRYAFPDQELIYHTRTSTTKKYEYFYNRRGLDILVLGTASISAEFDNIKLYEIDKVPFFKYATYDYINKAVQIPYQGIAPFIDYNDNEFSFIDNIDIGLDSLSTVQSFNPPTGVGGPVDPAAFDF
jgi:hypothetical protein